MNSDKPQSKLWIQTKIEQVFEEKTMRFYFKDENHQDFIYEFIVATPALIDFLEKHLDQASFISLLKEALEDPYEIWQAFQKHEATGQVRLLHRFVKAFDLKNAKVGVLVIFEAIEGDHRFKEFFVVREPNLYDQINHFRSGKLIFKRNEPRLGS